jgi:hypothetical protein
MRRGYLVYILPALFLAGCSGWTIQVVPYSPATLFPTPTPIIYSPTPIILVPPVTATIPSTPLILSLTPSLTPEQPNTTFTPTSQPTFIDTPITPATPTLTPTTNIGPTPFVSIRTDILGCNTSIDITHGMGEVTNAYVTISNTGTEELDNVCATLNALDEGRPHPDKTKCVASLPIGHQVTQKLTVDSTFQKSTSIQVDVTYSLGLLQRVAQDSCTNIGIFVPDGNDLGVVKPIP